MLVARLGCLSSLAMWPVWMMSSRCRAGKAGPVPSGGSRSEQGEGPRSVFLFRTLIDRANGREEAAMGTVSTLLAEHTSASVAHRWTASVSGVTSPGCNTRVEW
jgi:hypothetical protein